MTETLRPFSTARMSIIRDWTGNRLPEDHPWVCDGKTGFLNSPGSTAEKLAGNRGQAVNPRITELFTAVVKQLAENTADGVPAEILGCSIPPRHGREVAWLRADGEVIPADCGRLAVLRAVTRFDALAFIQHGQGPLVLALRKGELVGFLVALTNIEIPEEVKAL